MARCEDCLHYDICEIMNNQYGISKVHPIQCGFYKKTADVVPKSEVDNLKVLLEMNDKAYNGLRELYHTDTEALVLARQKTEIEVAREIFEEIETSLCYKFINGEIHLIIREEDYKEYKKKYTEEK